MKAITQEWVNKAEGDFATAQRELEVKESPNHDAVCFHSQQCIEKYLLDGLTTYAVEFRYPGASANQLLANQAFQDCSSIRQVIRQHLAS
jgi:HEPN domain-containing protein